jgi:armadillo repeat-containing protein 8
MTQSSLPLIFDELQHPASSATQLAALKALKNELIGHELRKRAWVNYGIIPILSRILSSRRSLSGKRATRELHGNGFQDGRGALSDDDASCLQAAVIVGILAHGRSDSAI